MKSLGAEILPQPGLRPEEAGRQDQRKRCIASANSLCPIGEMFDQVVKSFRPLNMRLLLTERPEKKHIRGLRAVKTGSKQIPGGKGTGGPMPCKGEDARPGPMVRGAAVSGVVSPKIL